MPVSPDTTSYTYKYGYLELRAIIPTGSYAPWAAFWLYANDVNYSNEIDIVENTGTITKNGHIIGNNVHTSATYSYATIDFGYVDTVAPLLSSAFHKYALKWEPHSLTFYFDDVPIRTFYDADGDSIPQNKMPVIIGLGVSPFMVPLPADWNKYAHGTNRLAPQTLEVDYFRYYKLNVACGTPLSVCLTSDYSLRKVQQSITAGGGTCTPNFNPTDVNGSYTLRATDYVILDAGTIVSPTGTGYFAIEMTACPN